MMSRPFDEQCIAALASGSGPGAVGIIRVSGCDALSYFKRCLSPSENTFRPRYTSLRQFIDPASSEVIDEVIVVFFQGPKSFTGQDTVEIFCHGGSYIIQRILGVLYSLGVRPAQPGEFTKRALLNGKLDITAAEGLKELIECQSKQQWVAGRQLYQGKLRDQVEALRREITGALGYLEAMIDFPDEGDTRHVQLEDVYRRIDTVLDQVHKLGATFKNGKVASRGLKVAIAGAPNAGKSTLLNSLLGRSRAIVSEQAGTTRDYLEEPCILDGRLIVLIDTAGIRNTDDVIERDGIAMSRQVLADADVVLALYALDSTPTDRNLIESILSSLKKPVIPIVSKSDLNTPPDWSRDLLCISCKTEAGLGQLRNKLTQLVDQATETIEERPFITSARQAAAISAAEDALIKFKTSAAKAAGHEMLAFELQEAARALKSIVGDISSDDVLDVIFREFCIGK